MYSRLQTRLNPVPESLNSPDIAPQASGDGLSKPPRDDPLRVYNRDIRVNLEVLFTCQKEMFDQCLTRLLK